MITAGQWDFFPERMVFVPRSLSEKARESCFTFYPILDDENANRASLFSNEATCSSFVPERINHVGFSLSDNCNLRCRYCSACSTEGINTAIPTSDVLCFVSDIMKKWMVGKFLSSSHPERLELYFTGGGEPTYDWDSFQEVVLGIKEKARTNDIPIYLGITTNGVYGLERSRFLAEHFNRIMVSYDGLPEIQNRNRVSPHTKDTSMIVEENLRLLCQKATDLTIRTTVWYEEFSRMKEMADFLFGTFGTRFTWNILPVSPMGRALKKLSTTRYDDERFDFLKWYLDLRTYCESRWYGSKLDTQFFSTTPAHVFCGSMAYSAKIVWLLANGNLITCLEAQDFPTIVGNVHEGRVEYYNRVNDPLLAKAQEMFEKCRNCYAYPFCKGGCPAKALFWEKAGSTEKPWECNQIIVFWKTLVETISQGKEFFGWKLQSSRYPEMAELGVKECIQPESKMESMQK